MLVCGKVNIERSAIVSGRLQTPLSVDLIYSAVHLDNDTHVIGASRGDYEYVSNCHRKFYERISEELANCDRLCNSNRFHLEIPFKRFEKPAREAITRAE